MEEGCLTRACGGKARGIPITRKNGTRQGLFSGLSSSALSFFDLERTEIRASELAGKGSSKKGLRLARESEGS